MAVGRCTFQIVIHIVRVFQGCLLVGEIFVVMSWFKIDYGNQRSCMISVISRAKAVEDK